MQLGHPGFMYTACGSFTKNKVIQKFKEQENHDIVIKMTYIKLAFNMTCLMETSRICLEEQLLVKYYMIKHLILLKIQNVMDINVDLLHWFKNVLIKSLQVVLLQLPKELHKPITKIFEKCKLYSIETNGPFI